MSARLSPHNRLESKKTQGFSLLTLIKAGRGRRGDRHCNSRMHSMHMSELSIYSARYGTHTNVERWLCMANPTNLIAQAERCRRLARGMDGETAKALRMQAEEYEAEARKLGAKLVPRSAN